MSNLLATVMPSKRNKTIYVSDREANEFQSWLTLTEPTTLAQIKNRVFLGDAIEVLPLLPAESVDLIVADPPYNLGKKFGAGRLRLSEADYKNWCRDWLTDCHRLLKPNGSIYICIDWPNSTMVHELLSNLFHVQNRITWQRDKGRGSKKNWKNNMEDIWFATKTRQYTFNIDAVKIKRPVIAPYVDKKGKPKDWFEENGTKYRLTHPSNIWTDMVVPFWSMPENTEHPTQKPEKLITRLLQASSQKHDVVLDPFMGSGTTAVAAKKLKRHYIGIEKDKKFYVLIHKRLESLYG